MWRPGRRLAWVAKPEERFESQPPAVRFAYPLDALYFKPSDVRGGGGRRGAGPQGGGAGGGGVAGCGAGPRTRDHNLPPDERWRCALWAVGVVVYFGGAVDETKYWRVVNSLAPNVQILPAP